MSELARLIAPNPRWTPEQTVLYAKLLRHLSDARGRGIHTNLNRTKLRLDALAWLHSDDCRELCDDLDLPYLDVLKYVNS